MTGLGILLAHLVGDYILQSDWMAQQKQKQWWPAIAHGLTYTLAYAFVTQSLLALFVIGATHVLIDHYRLAKHVTWLKNQIGPAAFRPGHTATGYTETSPAWLTVWLLFIADNTIHLLINTAAVAWL